jgi:acyl carrier protein
MRRLCNERTMEAKLRQIVAQIAEIAPDFQRDAHLRDELNVDSFRAVEIVFEVERAFEIKVPDSRYGEVQTFNDLLKLVTALKGG